MGDLIFVGCCQLVLFMRPHYMFSDGSTGWHLVTGFDILKNHAIPRADIMSYTFPGKAWVAYEWLSDAIMAMIVSAGGINLLAVCVALAIASLILALYQRMRSEGCHFALAMLFTIVGLIASANHWLVRPHIFTFWGVYIFYTRLEDFVRGKLSLKWLLAWLLPTMLVWVNTHPAFLFAFAITGLYFVITTGGALWASVPEDKQRQKKQAVQLFALLFGLLGVSFINPYGMELYHYIREYLHGTSILSVTQEFKSPDFKESIHAIFLELLFFFLALGLFLRGKVTATAFAMCIAFGHLALSAVRNISLFAFVSLPALGALYGSLPPNNFFTKFKQGSKEFNEQEKVSDFHILPILYGVALMAMCFVGKGDAAMVKSGFDPAAQPTTTLSYIKEQKLPANKGFNLDNWGGIIRYQLDMPVYIDDRADFYGEQFYGEYGKVCEVRSGWKEVLDKRGVEWVLFPKESVLVQALKSDPQWSVASEDAASTLMVRKK